MSEHDEIFEALAAHDGCEFTFTERDVETCTGNVLQRGTYESFADIRRLHLAEAIRTALAERERRVKAEALREAAGEMRACKDVGHWNLRDPHIPETAYSPDVWLERRADRIEEGDCDE